MLDAVNWLVVLLTGAAAVSITTLAVAAIGFSLLKGRVRYERFGRVILGCFVIFGAATIASASSALFGSEDALGLQQTIPVAPPEFQTDETIEGAYQPYPGAANPAQPGAEEEWLGQ